MTTYEPSETFRFRDFELDVVAYELRRKGRPVRLERRPMDLLILLVERRGQLVSRTDIVDRLWGKDVFVDVEAGINTAIGKVRQALRDLPDAPVCIETVAGKGYRFAAPVEVALTSRRASTSFVPRGEPLPESPASETAKVDAAAPSAWQVSPAIPRRRFSRGHALFAAGAVAVMLLAGFTAWVWIGRDANPSRVTVAVLPFENLGSDPEREHLAGGLAEETIAALGQVDPEHVSVVGRTSTLVYKATKKSLAQIGQELGADYLVESSIRADGALVRVTSKLIRARDQVQVWSSSYDREPISVLGMQRELSSAIAEQVRIRLSPDRLSGLERRQTRNPEAYDLYLRGRYFGNQRTPEGNARAVQSYEAAIVRDPHYALAWSGIADTYAASTVNGDAPPLTVGPRAREAAARAFQAEPDLAEVQSSRGYVSFLLEWNWNAAEAALRRAVELDSHYALAHRRLGVVLSQMGRHDEALAVMQRARELDPLEPMQHALSSQMTYQARDYSAAVEHARRAIVLDPEFWIAYVQIAQAYEPLGKTATAIEALNSAGRFSQRNSKALSLRGYLLAKLGRADEARDVLRTLEEVGRSRYVPPYAMALVHAGLGERDAVFDWLDKAYAARDVHLQFLPVDPKWDPFRSDPRFEALLTRCGFMRAPSPGP